MSKKKKLMISLITTLLVIIVLIGVAYALLRFKLNGEKTQVLRIGDLELKLEETGNTLGLESGEILTDEEGLELNGFDFTLKNDSTKTVDYTIYLDDVELDSPTDVRLEDKYLKYSLDKNGVKGEVKALTDTGKNPNRILEQGQIGKSQQNDYTLRLWVTSDVEGDITDQVFKAKIRVENILKPNDINIDNNNIVLDLNGKKEEQININKEELGEVTYQSKDKQVADVTPDGMVTAVGLGSTEIEVTSGSYKDVIRVKVQKTVEATYVKQGLGVQEIEKEKDSCILTSKEEVCEKTLPTITLKSDEYTAVGWNILKDSIEGQNGKIMFQDNVVYYAISYKNEVPYKVLFNGNGNVIDAEEKSCSLPKAYNDTPQPTSCTITTPIISVNPNTPDIIGYSTNASTHEKVVGSNEELELNKENNGTTYYAQTYKDKVTYTLTTDGNGVSGENKSASCDLVAVYNGASQEISCNVTLPSNPYSYSGWTFNNWSTDKSAESGIEPEQSVALKQNETYYALWKDITPPSIDRLYSGGMLYDDPTFEKGYNNIEIYNNAGNNNVVLTREKVETDVGNYQLKIITNGEAKPGLGGFRFTTPSSINEVFISRIRAKIPKGYKIELSGNYIAHEKWLTPQDGTEEWEEYIVILTSTQTSFENFYYIKGPSATESNPVTWYVSYATVYSNQDIKEKAGVSFLATDEGSGIVGYGLSKSEAVEPSSYIEASSVKSLGRVIENLTESKTYYLWVKDEAGNKSKKEIAVSIEAPAVDKLLSSYTNAASLQDFQKSTTAQQKNMYVFDHASNKGTQQSNWSSDELKDYRYIGANPNNYVTFNEEMWRIIGIETVDDGSGTKEKRIKLIKNDPLPVGTNNYISFDNKPSGTGSSESSYGSNDWTDSRLMMVLNPGYDSDPLATGGKGSLYWNRQSGSCPLGSSDGTTSCDFTSTGLKEEAQKLIGDAKWYLGGTANYQSADNGTANHFYSYERGETVYSSSEHSRKTSWTGKVGLMYPSDYGYATSGGTSKTRATCLSDTVYNYNAEDCKNNDWLFINGTYQWTIAPRTDGSYNVFNVVSGGAVYDNIATDSNSVARPVVYLKADTLYQSGDGSQSNSFVFVSPTSSDQGIEGPSSISITSNKQIVSSPTKVCQEEVSTGTSYNFDIDSTSEIKTGSICTTSNGTIVCMDYNNDINTTSTSTKSCMSGNSVTAYTKSSNSCSYVYVCDNNNKCSAKREC